MSMNACRDAIISVLDDYSGTPPIFAENVTIPNGVFGTEWSRWSIRLADVADSDIGARNERAVGTLYFQHFKPEGTGTKEAWAFADKIGTMFNRKVVTGGGGGILRFDRAICAFQGQTEGVTQHNVTVAFQWDAAALNAA